MFRIGLKRIEFGHRDVGIGLVLQLDLDELKRMVDNVLAGVFTFGGTPSHISGFEIDLLHFPVGSRPYHLTASKVDHHAVHGMFMQGAGMMRLLGDDENPRLWAVDFYVAGCLSPESNAGKYRQEFQTREDSHNS